MDSEGAPSRKLTSCGRVSDKEDNLLRAQSCRPYSFICQSSEHDVAQYRVHVQFC